MAELYAVTAPPRAFEDRIDPVMSVALIRAGIRKPFRPFHDLRHTALTHEAAARNPVVYVQLKAGHSQASIIERYIRAAQMMFPESQRGEGSPVR
jgi:integrase